MIEYNDRGRLKWTGFYLSDHTEKIDTEKEKRTNKNTGKVQMTAEEISEIIAKAVEKNKVISIQKEERDQEGFYPDDTVGKISGYDELGIYVGDEKVHYDEIRNVSFNDVEKWSQI